MAACERSASLMRPIYTCLLVIFSAFVVLYYSVGYMYRIIEEMYACL